MPQRPAIVVIGVGVFLLAIAGLAWVFWPRCDGCTVRATMTPDSIVMLGDSITEQAPWETAFPELPLVNQGYSGFTTAQLVEVAREVARAEPRAVYLLAGTNDIRDDLPPEWTIEHFTMLLDELASAGSDTTVVVQTLLPRQDRPDQVLASNEAIVQLARTRGLEVLELYASFDDGFGGLRTEDTWDGIHLSEAGNRRWFEILRQDFARR